MIGIDPPDPGAGLVHSAGGKGRGPSRDLRLGDPKSGPPGDKVTLAVLVDQQGDRSKGEAVFLNVAPLKMDLIEDLTRWYTTP